MLKPPSLRDHLLAHVPALVPDKLLTFITGGRGRIHSTAHGSLSFVYHYTLEVVLTDFSKSSDVVMVAVLQWIRQHQPELLLNESHMAERFTFEVDILNGETYDLGIKLQLTERVRVFQENGKNMVQHLPEPPLVDDGLVDPTWKT